SGRFLFIPINAPNNRLGACLPAEIDYRPLPGLSASALTWPQDRRRASADLSPSATGIKGSTGPGVSSCRQDWPRRLPQRINLSMIRKGYCQSRAIRPKLRVCVCWMLQGSSFLNAALVASGIGLWAKR
ncbi:MAG: hypothetical protein Q7T38_10960, partial [Gallionella sp.]|nr:hypothetical protein [Gallionella sp.]